MAKKQPVGRPRKSTSDLPKNWKEDITREYSLGASDVEIKAMIFQWMGSFSNDLWNRWVKEDEDFSTTISNGKTLSYAWWMRMGRLNLMVAEGAPKMNYTGWYMNMKNRFDWADKQETQIAATEVTQVTLNIDA